MTHPGRKSYRSTSEALRCRYARESWYVSVGAEDRGDGLVLYVRSGCPFRTHRPIEGRGVRVVVSAVRRPGSAA